MAGRWVDLREAAQELDISTEALRKRASRGTLQSRKGEDGKLYVRVDDDRTTGAQASRGRAAEQGELVEELRDRVRFLERALETEQEGRRRADTIIAQLSQATSEQARTIRELEAPRDEQNQPESAEPQPDRGNVSGEPESGAQRPWWRRVLRK